MSNMYCVFRCPRCGHFLYAPLGQKSRHCPYCQKIIGIDPNSAHTATTDDEARTMVKKYNAGKELKKFLVARKTSKEMISALFVTPNNAQDSKPLGKLRDKKFLLTLLRTYADRPLTLRDFERLAVENNLDLTWVREELVSMINKSLLTMPHPWEIQYMMSGSAGESSGENNQKITFPRNEIRRLITNCLELSNEPLSVQKILACIGCKQEDSEAIREVLSWLVTQGFVYEPKAGYYSWMRN